MLNVAVIRSCFGHAMVCDGIANVVIELQESGFDPRRVGPDSWESRCPAHRSAEWALSITRNEHNHVLLKCRSTQNCQDARSSARSVLRTLMCTPKPPIG